jgi:glucose/arabinose dehydrogenase
MKNLIQCTLLALFMGACATATIPAERPTVTPSRPEADVDVSDQAAAETVTLTLEPTPETHLALVMPDSGTAVWNLVSGDFRRPVALVHAGDERLFVVEQAGVIWIIQNGERLPEPFLDLRQSVNDRANEQGLLGLAFHPDYAQTGSFFLNYTGPNGETRISRFTRSEDPNRADPESETLMLTIDQPYGNHNGGSIAFGPQGYLYIGTGDGGSGGDPHGNGQRLDTFLGKILRLDIDSVDPYAIPPDNPFREGGALPEIWAYGLRNPWRFAFDRASGNLFIADVGQNQWEEINFQAATSHGGENYGWNLREGAHAYAGGAAAWTDPVAEYSHAEGCSVTGGEVVRDTRLIAWSGVYLYADYCSGQIWGLLGDGQGSWSSQLLYDSDFNPTSFGQDSIGRIYLVDHRGEIYRLEPTS